MLVNEEMNESRTLRFIGNELSQKELNNVLTEGLTAKCGLESSPLLLFVLGN